MNWDAPFFVTKPLRRHCCNWSLRLMSQIQQRAGEPHHGDQNLSGAGPPTRRWSETSSQNSKELRQHLAVVTVTNNQGVISYLYRLCGVKHSQQPNQDEGQCWASSSSSSSPSSHTSWIFVMSENVCWRPAKKHFAESKVTSENHHQQET